MVSMKIQAAISLCLCLSLAACGDRRQGLKFETHFFPAEGHPFAVVNSVTASLGVAALRPEDSLDGLIERAERNLLVAKERGHNRVCNAVDSDASRARWAA